MSLALCAVLELMAGKAALGGLPSVADPDAIRHTYLAGFISLLLFGMAPRVIPGFLHKRQVARPGLVVATFWIAGTSGLFRVAPLLMANSLDYIPYGLQISMWAFGLSGLLGWIAAAILGYNLWATWRR